MTKTFELLKMQKFIFLMILMVIVNAAIISAKSEEDIAVEKLLADIRKKCSAFAKLTKEQTKMVLEHKLLTKDTVLADTPKEIQCYCACHLEGFGLFVDGKPNEKHMREVLPLMINDKKKSDAALNKCLKLEGKDKCEMGFNFQLCVIKETGLDLY